MPDHAAPAPELLTIAEAAELLRTPAATLRFWRHRSSAPRSFRLGHRVLYRRNNLHAWIAACHDQDRRNGKGQGTLARPNDGRRA